MVPNHGFQEVPGGSGAGSERQFPGAGSVPHSEPRVLGRFRGRFRFTSSGKFPGQVPNHGFRGRFRGTGFCRDGSRTVLARFLDFRKRLMTYDPNVATFLLVSSCGKTLGKNTFSQHALQKWQCGNFADSDV